MKTKEETPLHPEAVQDMMDQGLIFYSNGKYYAANDDVFEALKQIQAVIEKKDHAEQ